MLLPTTHILCAMMCAPFISAVVAMYIRGVACESDRLLPSSLSLHFSPPSSSKVVVAVVTALEGTPVALGTTLEDLGVGLLIATVEGSDQQPMQTMKAGTNHNNSRLVIIAGPKHIDISPLISPLPNHPASAKSPVIRTLML